MTKTTIALTNFYKLDIVLYEGHFLAYAHGTKEETYKRNYSNKPKQEPTTSLTSLTS